MCKCARFSILLISVIMKVTKLKIFDNVKDSEVAKGAYCLSKDINEGDVSGVVKY